MNFFVYVIAWTFITSLTVIICSFIGKLSRFIVNHTPLRRIIINKNKEYYKEVAFHLAEHLCARDIPKADPVVVVEEEGAK